MNKIANVVVGVILAVNLKAFASPIESDITTYAAKAKQCEAIYKTSDEVAAALGRYYGATFWVKNDGYVVAQGNFNSGLTYYREFKAQDSIEVDTSYISVWSYP